MSQIIGGRHMLISQGEMGGHKFREGAAKGGDDHKSEKTTITFCCNKDQENKHNYCYCPYCPLNN